ncbi:hypothetical protein RYF71_07025 [Wolbachia endosymbiont of Drosophila malagassya]|nr:hypothetical protein [Wolbachia endosymbiont of Drosophila malagassya]
MSPLDPSALFLSSQCPILVIPVPYSCHPSALFLSSQCPDTGISFYFIMMS